jgi:LemA protein
MRDQQYYPEYARTQQRSGGRHWVGVLLGLLALAVILGAWAASKYNTLQTKRENVRMKWSGIDSQLQRRADLIPNLVNTVKGYAKHEEKVFGDIAAARSRLLSAQTPEDKAGANDQLSGALGRLLALSENYPNLKADQNFKSLQYELAGTENRINVARTDYNQAVFDYNTTLQRFPTVLIARLLGFQRAEEFKAAEGAREVPQVTF